MRKVLSIGLAVLMIAAIGAYLYLQDKEFTFRFTEAELQETLALRLPISKTYLFIFEVVLDEPRLSLVEGSNRVNAGLDVTLNIYINDNPLPLGGAVDVSGGVRYDAAEGQFFLTDPIIENLAVQGIPARYTDQVNSVLTKALGEFYEERPIYTLDDANMKTAAARLVLKNVVVENKVLVVTLGL